MSESPRTHAESCDRIATAWADYQRTHFPCDLADYPVGKQPRCPCGGVLYLERSKWRCRDCGRYDVVCCEGSRG